MRRLTRQALYEQDACETLGDLFDVCVNDCGVAGDRVVDAFLASGLAHEFEWLNPAFVGGRSAVELAEWLAPWLGVDRVPCHPALDRSREWWLGSCLGRFQLVTGRSYASLFAAFGFDELVGMYHPLHEASEEKFIDIVCARLDATRGVTQLAVRRGELGLTQAELATCSGVGLRSIQMYEQRRKDLSRAQASTLQALSRVLGCTMENLMEPGGGDRRA